MQAGAREKGSQFREKGWHKKGGSLGPRSGLTLGSIDGLGFHNNFSGFRGFYEPQLGLLGFRLTAFRV